MTTVVQVIGPITQLYAYMSVLRFFHTASRASRHRSAMQKLMRITTHPVYAWRAVTCHDAMMQCIGSSVKEFLVDDNIWPRSWPWAHPGCRPTWEPSCASFMAIQPFCL